MCARVCMFAHMRVEGSNQDWMSFSVVLSLRRGFSPNLELSDLVRPAGQQAYVKAVGILF